MPPRLAALLADLGRPRLLGSLGADGAPRLADVVTPWVRGLPGGGVAPTPKDSSHGVVFCIESYDWTLAQPLAAQEPVHAVASDGVSTVAGHVCVELGLRGACVSELAVLLLVRDVKANIGQVEPAAGMTGLLTPALGLARGKSAPSAQLRALPGRAL